jgi:hypothetical protein
MGQELLSDWVRDLEIPELRDVQRLSLNPGDMLVVVFERELLDVDASKVRATLYELLPENKIVVFGMPVRLAVLGPEDTQ